MTLNIFESDIRKDTEPKVKGKTITNFSLNLTWECADKTWFVETLEESALPKGIHQVIMDYLGRYQKQQEE